MDETRKLAHLVKKVRYEDLPLEVVEKAKELILDQLGCELAGSTLPWGQATYRYVRDIRTVKKESSVVHYGLRTAALDAAFANASFGRSVEVDDVEPDSASHVGSIVISGALAAGERDKTGGKEFVKAIVMGYEVVSRLGRATRGMATRGFYPTLVFGPFGAAAATGLILGLDEDAILNALSIAASHASGLREYTLSTGTVNRVHGGIAAYGGMRAALLAQRGFTGPATILEGTRGFGRAFADKGALEDISYEMTKEFAVLRVALRRYCCCGRQNSSLDAVSKIASEHAVRASDIDRITVRTGSSTVDNVGVIVEPKDITNAQFSGRFGIALRIVKGGNRFRDYYNEENLQDPEISGLIKKIDYVVDDDLAKVLQSKGSPATVEARMKDGTVYRETVDAARGTSRNPMTKEERHGKFRELASTALPEQEVEKIIETVSGLERLNDIHRLTKLLVAGKPAANTK